MSEPLLSILIPTIVGREAELYVLLSSLQRQDKYGFVLEVLVEKDNREMSIGKKRNKLLDMAAGKYLCFIDDDDSVSENYIELLIEAAKSGCDCASLKGEITIDGGEPEIFEHSLIYDKWHTNPEGTHIRYERFPNHLNMIKTSIAKLFKFPEKNHGEDYDWSTELHKSRLLETEHYIPEILYYYNFISNK